MKLILIDFYSCLFKDPAVALREQCAKESQCRALKVKLEECTKRVESHPGTTENCQEELFDFLKCVDNCVRHTL